MILRSILKGGISTVWRWQLFEISGFNICRLFCIVYSNLNEHSLLILNKKSLMTIYDSKSHLPCRENGGFKFICTSCHSWSNTHNTKRIVSKKPYIETETGSGKPEVLLMKSEETKEKRKHACSGNKSTSYSILSYIKSTTNSKQLCDSYFGRKDSVECEHNKHKHNELLDITK